MTLIFGGILFTEEGAGLGPHEGNWLPVPRYTPRAAVLWTVELPTS
jgi:hypothetical protein